MSLDERTSNLIKQIYCARDDVHAWEKISYEALGALGACAGLSTIVDLGQCHFKTLRVYGLEGTRVALGLDEYQEIYKADPSLIWAAANPRARFCDSRNGVPRERYLSDEFIKWNRSRFGSLHWYVGYTAPDDQLSFSLSVHFPADQGFGKTEQIDLFRMLFDHMESAIRLSRRPFNPESARALLLLDSAGVVQTISTGAEQLLRQNSPVEVRDGRLLTACAADQFRIDRAIAQALSVTTTGSGPSGLRLVHPASKRSWIVIIRPLLSSSGPFAHTRCELMVELFEGLPKVGTLGLVKALYKLTGRELALLRLLADGHSLRSAAAQMEISIHTARAHLRSIFAKTETSRQSELMHLAAGFAQ